MANEHLVERLLWHGEFHIGEAEVSISYQFLDELVEALRAQPSAASGRELPKPAYTIRLNQDGTPGEVSQCDQDSEMWAYGLAYAYSEEQMRAALTGAAPADANVGGQVQIEYTADNGETWQSCELIGLHSKVEMIPCYLGAMHGYRFVHPQCLRYADTKELVYNHGKKPTRLRPYGYATTAPEPSAPADKADAERYRTLRAQMTFHDINPAFDLIGKNIPVLARVSKRVWYHATDDIQNDGLDAAIDRMRSESGKSGKL